jgi:hypothetical protein
LKIQSLKLPLVKQSATSTKTPVTAARPFSLPPNTSFRAAKSAALTDERRRTQRVLLRVRANIHVALQGKAVTFDAVTLSVNDHGALIALSQNLPLGTSLVLEHAATKERVNCKVARPARSMPEGFHTPIEFEAPAPDFWRIAFPPNDWRPEDT